MTDILTPTPCDELIADMDRRLRDMQQKAHEDCCLEEERSHQWCRDRMWRFEQECYHIRRMHDAMLRVKAELDGTFLLPVHVIPLDNPTFLSRGMQAALKADGEKLHGLTGEDHGPFEDAG